MSVHKSECSFHTQCNALNSLNVQRSLLIVTVNSCHQIVFDKQEHLSSFSCQMVALVSEHLAG